MTKRRKFFSLDIAWNDPRHSPCRRRHGLYHGLLPSASLDDGPFVVLGVFRRNLLEAICHWAQPPEGVHILSQEKLRGPPSVNAQKILKQVLRSTYRIFFTISLEAQGQPSSVCVRQPDAKHMADGRNSS